MVDHCSISQRTTTAPASAKASAIARPIPFAPPVMTVTVIGKIDGLQASKGAFAILICLDSASPRVRVACKRLIAASLAANDGG